MDLLRAPPPSSQIAQERVEPEAAPSSFYAAAAALGALAAVLAGYLGRLPVGPLPIETDAGGAPGSLLIPLGWHGARIASALLAGAAVLATAIAARRLLHSTTAALVAAALVAADPGLLAAGRLALPDTFAVSCLLGALAAFLCLEPKWHWVGAGLLLLGALVEPRGILWALPMCLLLLLRGHIYAAPRHLGLSALQTVAPAIVGAGLHIITTGGDLYGLPCKSSFLASLAILQVPSYGGGIVQAHNPATWFGGLGALVVLGGAAAWIVLRQFRIARLPGKIQMRLSLPLDAQHARVFWLLAFALLVPAPILWAPIFAIGLAAGLQKLSEDAPGFGAAVGLVVLLLAVVGLWRGWGLLTGTGDPADLVPWTATVSC